MEPDYQVAAVAALVLAIVSTVPALFVSGGAYRDYQAEAIILRHARFFRGFALFFLPFTLGVWAIIATTLLRHAPLAWTEAVIIGPSLFVVLAGLLVLEGFRMRVTVTEAGVTKRSRTGSVFTIRWEQIDKVTSSGLRILIHGRGSSITLPSFVSGLDFLARECQKRLAPGKFEAALYGYLRKKSPSK